MVSLIKNVSSTFEESCSVQNKFWNQSDQTMILLFISMYICLTDFQTSQSKATLASQCLKDWPYFKYCPGQLSQLSILGDPQLIFQDTHESWIVNHEMSILRGGGFTIYISLYVNCELPIVKHQSRGMGMENIFWYFRMHMNRKSWWKGGFIIHSTLHAAPLSPCKAPEFPLVLQK